MLLTQCTMTLNLRHYLPILPELCVFNTTKFSKAHFLMYCHFSKIKKDGISYLYVCLSNFFRSFPYLVPKRITLPSLLTFYNKPIAACGSLITVEILSTFFH